MLVEMYKENGFWHVKDNFDTLINTGLVDATALKEATQDNKSDLKKVIKLKEAGFTSEEIIEMSKEKVV